MFSRECFINNDYWWSAGSVLFGKAAASNYRNLHCFKIVRCADTITPIILLTGRRFCRALDQIVVRDLVTVLGMIPLIPDPFFSAMAVTYVAAIGLIAFIRDTTPRTVARG